VIRPNRPGHADPVTQAAFASGRCGDAATFPGGSAGASKTSSPWRKRRSPA